VAGAEFAKTRPWHQTLCRSHPPPAALVDAHYDIRTIQELLGHKDVPTTMIHTHGLKKGGRGVQSPADRLGPESFREPEP